MPSTDPRHGAHHETPRRRRGAYVDPAAGKVGLGEWAERWYAATAHLKPSTRRDYRMPLDHQVLPVFGDWTLASIDTLAVKEWRAGLLAGGLSPKRAGKALQVLSQVLGSAVEGAGWPATPPRASSLQRFSARRCTPGRRAGRVARGGHRAAV
jgi:Phage integrase, N-terminal SAM-like domain